MQQHHQWSEEKHTVWYDDGRRDARADFFLAHSDKLMQTIGDYVVSGDHTELISHT